VESFKDNDLVGYEALLEVIAGAGVRTLPGDFLEVGAFLGGGTAKLARFCAPLGKKVFTIDLMEPSTDGTRNTQGHSMSDLYAHVLAGRSQEQVFHEMVKGCDNVTLLKEDSRSVTLPSGTKLCFAFIDGNHDPEYVRNDFLLAWRHLVPGGAVAFHDFEGDLPVTTDAIRRIVEDFREEIERVEQLRDKWVLFVFKRTDSAEPSGLSADGAGASGDLAS
jgi:predicted O-methyltransferase YrrM